MSPVPESSDIPSVNLPLELVREWSSAPDFATALSVMAKWIPTFLPADRVSVSLVVPDGTNVEIFKLTGEQAIPTGTFLPIEGTLLGKVITSRTTLYIPSLAESLFAREAPVLLQAGLKSALNAPLVGAGECFGTLNLARTSEDAFSAADETLLTSIAEVLGATLFTLRRIETERTLVNTDALTGLSSRRHILDSLAERLKSSSAATPVLFIDLDGFKAVNDAYGHQTGDRMLAEIARRMLAECPDSHVGRIGGDEFLVLCPEGSDRTEALELARHLIDVCTQPVRVGPIVLQPQFSVGVAAPESHTTTVSELLAQADYAMYKAKRSNTSLVEADADLRHQTGLIAAVDSGLADALANDSMELHYQPIRRLETGEILGCEALLRWFHPEVGFIPPPLIIERAALGGRIDALTEWSIDRVARDLSTIRQHCPDFRDKGNSFNLSPRQFGWVDYVDTHMRTLERYSLKPADILIEVVESGTIEVETTAENTIHELAEKGVKIALDDYGTGYNVISYFSRFPIHGIKIDRSMISAMADSPTIRTIVKGLTQMATELNISALGEGIETQADLDACIDVGLPLGQGYFLGRPMPLDALLEVLDTEHPTEQSEEPFAEAS